MANPNHLDTREEDNKVSASDLHRLLALHTDFDAGMVSEGWVRLRSLFDKDAPRDHFTATSTSPKTPSLADAHSLEQETDSMIRTSVDPVHLAREYTDSEKAVKGSDDDSATVKELAGHIANDSSDELYRRGKEAEAIINGTDLAFSDHFGSHFEKEGSDDLSLWPLAASNREEAEAMVEGLERAHGAIRFTL